MNFPRRSLTTPSSNLPAASLQAFETAVYRHLGRVLDTYALPGEARPRRTSQIGTTATAQLLRSGYLDARQHVALLRRSLSQDQARTVDREIRISHPGVRADPASFRGRYPEPTWQSAVRTQTGPNYSGLRRVAIRENHGDTGWLRREMPTIERALAFLTDRLDPTSSSSMPQGRCGSTYSSARISRRTPTVMVRLLRDVRRERFVATQRPAVTRLSPVIS